MASHLQSRPTEPTASTPATPTWRRRRSARRSTSFRRSLSRSSHPRDCRPRRRRRFRATVAPPTLAFLVLPDQTICHNLNAVLPRHVEPVCGRTCANLPDVYDTLHEVGVSSFAAMTPQIQIEKKNL